MPNQEEKEELLDNEFGFNIPIEKTYKDDDGNPHVIAIASSNREDKESETVSEKGLEHLATQIRESDDIEFKNHHEAAFGFGKAVDANVREVEEEGETFYVLEVDFLLKEEWPHSEELFNEVKSGDCDKELSIGGQINGDNPGAVRYVFQNGRRKKLIDEINLDHIVACPADYGANNDTHFIDAIVKTFDENNDALEQYQFSPETVLDYKNDIFFQSENPELLQLVQNINKSFKNQNAVTLCPVIDNGDFYVGLVNITDEVKNGDEFKNDISVHPLEKEELKEEKEEKLKNLIIDEIKSSINNVSKNEDNEEKDTKNYEDILNDEEQLEFLLNDLKEIGEMEEKEQENESEDVEKTKNSDEDETKIENKELQGAVDYKATEKQPEDEAWNFTGSDADDLLLLGAGVDSMDEFMELSPEDQHEGWKMLRDAHAYVNEEVAENEEFSDAPHNKNAYGLPHHKAVDGSLSVYLSGVISQMTKINGSNGGFQMVQDESELEDVYNHLAQHYNQYNREAPQFDPPQFESKEEEVEDIEEEGEKQVKRFKMHEHQNRLASYLSNITELDSGTVMGFITDSDFEESDWEFAKFISDNSSRTTGEVLDFFSENKSIEEFSDGSLDLSEHKTSVVHYISEITYMSGSDVEEYLDEVEINANPMLFVDFVADHVDMNESQVNEFLRGEQLENKITFDDFVPNNPENSEPVESEEWDSINYEEFRPELADALDKYDSAEDVPEMFVDLPVSEKEWISRRYSVVIGNEITEETEFSALKLEHHRVNGDVDRAGLIAARQRLPSTDADESALEQADQHITSHLRNDFNEEDTEPIMERKDGELQVREEALEDDDIDYESAKHALKMLTDLGSKFMDSVTKDSNEEEKETKEEVTLDKDEEPDADEEDETEIRDEIKEVSEEEFEDLELEKEDLNDEEVEYLEDRFNQEGDDSNSEEENQEDTETNEESENEEELSTEKGDVDMSTEKLDQLIDQVSNVASKIEDIDNRVDELESQDTEDSEESTNEEGSEEEDLDVDPDSLEDEEPADSEGDEPEAEADESSESDSESELEDEEPESSEEESEESSGNDSDDEGSEEPDLNDEKLDSIENKIDTLAGVVENLNGRVSNIENRTSVRQGIGNDEVNKTENEDEPTFSGVIFNND